MSRVEAPLYNKIQRAAPFFSGRQNQPRADQPQPALHLRRPLPMRNRAFAESGFDGHAQSFSLSKRGENRKFLLLDAAEVNGVVDAVHGQKNLRWLQLCNSANAFALAMLRESVAGEIRVFVFFAHFKEKIVYGITETQQSHVRLNR